MRLDKMLSDCGIAPRREIKKIIQKGEISLNGEVAKNGAVHIDPEKDEVFFRGEKVTYEKFIYIMMNKPQGYISATEDRYKKTVVELVPEEFSHFDLFPAGRLDIDTEGMLILTNDGDTAHKMLSPKKHVEKEYFVRAKGKITEKHISLFEEGLDLGDFVTKSAKLNVESATDDFSKCTVIISEGKFHQVKRMFEKIGSEVLYLKRIRMGSLFLDDSLSLGECRKLTADEVSKLLQ